MLRCSPIRVERNIRTVIDHAWRNNPEFLSELAGFELTQQPNVTQFLDILVTFMLHEQSRPFTG